MREKYQVLRYDCRGQGKSPKPDSIYHLDDHVMDLRYLIDQQKLGKVILVGLSNGARVALEYARRFGENVTAVVACDTYDEPTPMIKAKLGSWLNAYEVGGALHRFDVATPWIWGEDIFNEKSELLLSYRSQAASIEAVAVKGLILGAMETKIELEDIRCPVLFIVGKEDLLTPPFLHEKMQAKIKTSVLEIVGGGHASLIERPGIVEKTILPWIESLT